MQAQAPENEQPMLSTARNPRRMGAGSRSDAANARVHLPEGRQHAHSDEGADQDDFQPHRQADKTVVMIILSVPCGDRL